ncbi:MAG: tRNA (N(6)-L-threonylcarbamoyladenosine(37)-C(2))-methylthiotransferase MtaB [Alphaproteobacteria bacterium]|nr:tRNA (N(6)-L-threonylcarbamoyladenosine(37)-C(2))-methylthiotransferase MtaB [Alphaproteobacteria bacterium]
MIETVTFGCRLNISESERMQRMAAAAGLTDAVIVNTCAVTAEAERQAGQAIRRLKREKPQARIIVTGCAAQIDPEKYAAMREIDHLIDNDEKLNPASFAKLSGQPATLENSALPPPAEAAMQRAFIQIQNGCNHRCTFCIIPYGRGASRSLPSPEIAAQTKTRMAEGFNEIVLTGVDIASYGRDLPDTPSLGAMIRNLLAAVPDLRRLRLSSLDPAAIDGDLWQLIADEPRLMPHLHLSLQAGDDMVLKRMKRRHSRDDVLRLCDRARNLRPDIVFGADIIAGFPTESDAMFENTYNLVEQCGLTWLHVFPYSARKGTPAAKMPQTHGSLRKERAERLRAFGESAARRHYEALIGRKTEVLVEKNGIGCTPHFAKLKLRGDARVGEIVAAHCIGIEQAKVL